MNHDFKDFIENNSKIPPGIYSDSLKYAQMTLNPKTLLTKFYLTNLFGALLTLTICPQYGIGPFGGETGLVQNIMNMGPVWCGLFCSILFFAGGNLLALICLSRIERKWISTHEYSVLTPYIAILFSIGMGARTLFSGHIHHDVLSFYVSWLAGAIIFCVLFYKVAQPQRLFSK
jgi:hypothetical protein